MIEGLSSCPGTSSIQILFLLFSSSSADDSTDGGARTAVLYAAVLHPRCDGATDVVNAVLHSVDDDPTVAIRKVVGIEKRIMNVY